MLQIVNKYGEMLGNGKLTIVKNNGKEKIITPTVTSVWGNITGTLSNQIDLQDALNLKYDASNPNNYISGITSSDVTTALGYNPVNQDGDSMLGYLTLVSDPASSLHAATKQYVDNLSAGINFHQPCHVATTENLSATYLNGTAGVGATLTSTVNQALVIDTHTLNTGERVLVWQQSSAIENGIYDVTNTGSPSTPWVLRRSSDADNSPNGELQNGDFTFIQQGALYGGYGFILNTTGPITVGTTIINYVQFNAAQAVAAGYGLQELTPNVLSVDTSLIATLSSLSAYLTSAVAASTYYPLANPSGYISDITNTMIAAALGYTPYNSSNPSGYISGITSSDVTTALGYAPYNSTNPAGYITSSALASYLPSSEAASTYTPLIRNLTINGVTQNLSADRSWTISGGTITNFEGTLTADVTMTSTNTWYTGASVALTAGTWLINAHITLNRTTTTAQQYQTRIHDVTNNASYASSQQYQASVANAPVSMALTAILTLTDSATIAIQAASSTSTNNLIKAATLANSSGNNATQITAIKLS